MSRSGHNKALGRKRKKLSFKLILSALFAVVVLLYFLHYEEIIKLPEWFTGENDDLFDPPKDGSAQVYFIDVGQGDCELIVSDDGSTVLIDSGEEEYSPVVLRYLGSLGIDHLDFIIATHPHSDHIGGLADIITNIDSVENVIMPKIPNEFIPTSYCYEDFLEAILNKGCKAKYAESETFSLGSGNFEITVPEYSGENLNNYSLITKFTFGDIKFLMCGDLEWEMEQKIRKSGFDASADVYKLSHHGSSTSNQVLWLAAISPEYFVCECGAGNSYGHPHKEVLQTIDDLGGTLLRTDLNGSIVFETDGRNISYKTEK